MSQATKKYLWFPIVEVIESLLFGCNAVKIVPANKKMGRMSLLRTHPLISPSCVVSLITRVINKTCPMTRAFLVAIGWGALILHIGKMYENRN